MVKRLPSQKIAVFDLDGTLLTGNSLYIYIRSAISLRHPLRTLNILFRLLLRALHLISHAKMKFALLKSINPDREVKTRFVKNCRFNDKVLKEIEMLKSRGFKVILATAASEIYVPWIWKDEFVATKDNDSFIECRAQIKANEIMKLIEENDYYLYAVYTDHYDDAPLFNLGAEKNYLVNPGKKTLRKLSDKLDNIVVF